MMTIQMTQGIARRGTVIPRAVTLLAVVLAFFLSVGTARAAAHAGVAAPGESDPVSWSVSTPDNEFGSGRPNYQYEISPGATIADGIVVTNHADRELTLSVYAADGFINAGGQLDLLPATATSSELGSWVDVSAETITLPAGESQLVPFAVTVPANAPPGDYTAGVVTSLVSANADGVTVDRRLGSRMYVRVTGDIVAGLTLSDPVVSYSGSLAPWQPGTVQVEFTVTNSGNVRLDTDATVQVAGPWGVGASTVALDDLPEMLPGESVQRTVEINDVWPVLRANVVLLANGVAAQDGSAPTSAEATDSAWAMPWMILGLLVIAAGLIWWHRRRVAHRKQQSDDKVALAVQNALRDAGVGEKTDR